MNRRINKLTKNKHTNKQMNTHTKKNNKTINDKTEKPGPEFVKSL